MIKSAALEIYNEAFEEIERCKPRKLMKFNIERVAIALNRRDDDINIKSWLY